MDAYGRSIRQEGGRSVLNYRLTPGSPWPIWPCVWWLGFLPRCSHLRWFHLLGGPWSWHAGGRSDRPLDCLHNILILISWHCSHCLPWQFLWFSCKKWQVTVHLSLETFLQSLACLTNPDSTSWERLPGEKPWACSSTAICVKVASWSPANTSSSEDEWTSTCFFQAS